MQQRRGAIAAICVLVALVAAACVGAAAVPRTPDRPGATGSSTGSSAGSGVGAAPAPGDDREWRLSPAWALHPELLQGSDRFQELARKGEPTPGERPNVVLITTDDMTADDLRWMPKTRALLGDAGVGFADSLSPHPLCCPARAEILTGQFTHNNGVRSNVLPHGGYRALDSSNTLPLWLQRAGYQTAFMGKYLNGYGLRAPHHVPPGWENWRAPVRGVYDYNNFTVNENGAVRKHVGEYQTEYYADQTDRLVSQMAGADRPFFLWQSHLAPHGSCPSALRATRGKQGCWGPPTPSVTYEGVFDDVEPPQRSNPSYNEPDVSDKPSHIRGRASMPPQLQAEFTEIYQRRIESLQSVDDAVARTVDALEDAGELDDTLILFTSDNGYLLGEHRYRGKILPYEHSLRVPLLMRGPSVPAGVRRPATVATVDLAPTILAAAGAEAGLTVDGRNLLPVAQGKAPGWDTILVQGGPRGRVKEDVWLYRGVRTKRYTYAEYRQTGELELYDRLRDPFELENVAGDPAYAQTQRELRRRLLLLQDCVGAECRRSFGPVPAPDSGR